MKFAFPYLCELVRATIASALAFGLGAEINQRLYEYWIVPILPTGSEVPLSLWAASVAPGFCLILGTVILARSWGAVALAAISGGLARQLVLTRFAEQGRPGHHKSFALEDPDRWWTTQLVATVLSVGVCLVLVRLLAAITTSVAARIRSRAPQESVDRKR